MSKREKILEIRKKLLQYSEYLLEYGFNTNTDQVLIDNITSLEEELTSIESELLNEEGKDGKENINRNKED